MLSHLLYGLLSAEAGGAGWLSLYFCSLLPKVSWTWLLFHTPLRALGRAFEAHFSSGTLKVRPLCVLRTGVGVGAACGTHSENQRGRSTMALFISLFKKFFF